MKIEIIPRFKSFEKLVEAHPPVRANKFIPEWYKSMKPGTELASFLEEFHGVFSDNAYGARKCPAIRDLMFEGLYLCGAKCIWDTNTMMKVMLYKHIME